MAPNSTTFCADGNEYPNMIREKWVIEEKEISSTKLEIVLQLQVVYIFENTAPSSKYLILTLNYILASEWGVSVSAEAQIWRCRFEGDIWFKKL